MNADWFYSKGDQRMGPVTEDDLKQLATQRQLQPSDLVWRDGMPDWVEARSVTVLFPPKVGVIQEGDHVARRQFENLDDDRPAARVGRGRFEDDDDDHPRRRQRYRDDDDDELDRLRSRRRERDDSRYDYDDRPRSRSKQKPGQIQAVAIMTLVGGIYGVLWFLGFAASCVGLVWPGIWYELVIGILAIVRASNMLGRDDQGPPRSLAIMLIICIINLDIIACVLGIVSLVLLNDDQVKAYYRKKGFY